MSDQFHKILNTWGREDDPITEMARGYVEELERAKHSEARLTAAEALAEAVREFIDWFDTVFPKGGKNHPGLSLYTHAEHQRAALKLADDERVRVREIPSTEGSESDE